MTLAQDTNGDLVRVEVTSSLVNPAQPMILFTTADGRSVAFKTSVLRAATSGVILTGTSRLSPEMLHRVVTWFSGFCI